MASQAAFFGHQPPPPIKKASTPSSTTTESSSSKTKNGIKTITTKYVTTTREPTDAPDQNTDTINKETRTYNDGTTDDITLTRKVLGGMQYDIETIIRVQTKDVGSKKTKTTYSTPYQELDPVTGKPINAFNRVTHTGADHAMAPPELAGQIAQRAPAVSNQSHNVVPVTTGPGAPAPAPAPPAQVGSTTAAASATATTTTTMSSTPAGSAAPTPTAGATAPAATGVPASSAAAPATTAAPAAASGSAPAAANTTTPTTSTTPAPAGETTTTTTTTVVEEGGGCCRIL